MLLFPEPSVHRSRRCVAFLGNHVPLIWVEWKDPSRGRLSFHSCFFYPWPGRVFGVSFREPESGSSRTLVKCTPSFRPPPAAVPSHWQMSFSCASLSGCHFSTTFLSPSIFLGPREWKVPYPRSGVGNLPWVEGDMYCLEIFNFSLFGT